MNDENIKEEDKGKAGLLTGSTYYQFRIAVSMSSNTIYSNILKNNYLIALILPLLIQQNNHN